MRQFVTLGVVMMVPVLQVSRRQQCRGVLEEVPQGGFVIPVC